MEFAFRENEVRVLQDACRQVPAGGSVITLLTGDRGVGKTQLVLHACQQSPLVYWFASRQSEAMLCQDLADCARQSLDASIPEDTASLTELFERLVQIGQSKSFTLVIDEVKHLQAVNASLFSRFRDIWARYRKKARVHLVLVSSDQAKTKRLFGEKRDSFFWSACRRLHLEAFSIEELKVVMDRHVPGYAKEDLLALYAFTGGVPKYVARFVDARCLTKPAMIRLLASSGDLLLQEGRLRLADVLENESVVYRSILCALAHGKTTLAAIASFIGKTDIGGHLKRLEEDYGLIVKRRAMFSKPSGQSVRYSLCDSFLRLRFRFFVSHRAWIESGKNEQLETLIGCDAVFEAEALAAYFRQKFRESGRFAQVGAWWTRARSTPAVEIELAAVSQDEKTITLAEIRRDECAFGKTKWSDAVETFRTQMPLDQSKEIRFCRLGLADM